MSIRWQIALALAAIAAAVGSAAGVGSYVSTARELRRTVDQSLATVSDRFSDESADDRASDGLGRPGDGDRDGGSGVAGCPDLGDLAPATDVRLISTSGAVTVCLTSADGLIDVPQPTTAGYRTEAEGQQRYRVLVAVTPQGSVQVARSLTETDDVLARLRFRLAVLVASGITVALAAGWVLAVGIARPIVRLRDTAQAIAETGDLETPIPQAGRGEVSSLGRSFRAMVAALATSRDQQRRLVDDAGHEMRTPLTSLTTNLEHLDHFEQLPPEERREVLDAVQVDVDELTNLLTELVELATDRADDEEPELLSLPTVVGDVAQRAARRSGRPIEVRTASSADGRRLLVSARPHLLERAISNLLDNALKYTETGTEIEVTVDAGRIEVRDRGPGIEAVDRDHVFDRFYRATTARTAPGSGLGLAIVRQIVEGHGGTVWARARDDGPGAAVGFELPTTPDGP